MTVPVQSDNLNLPLVASLTQFDRGSLALAGGKGANLGELIKAGFDVPPAFVITTAAYDFLLQTNGLQAIIQEMLTSLQTDNPAAVTGLSQRIRGAIQHASIPDPIANETLKAYRPLGS